MSRMIINGGEKWVPLSELNESMSSEGLKDLRVDDLEKALRVYGNHLGGCPAWGRPRPDLCTCGYVAAFGTIANYESLSPWPTRNSSKRECNCHSSTSDHHTDCLSRLPARATK